MNLQVALAAFAPQIAESFAAITRRELKRVTEEFGADHRGVYNSNAAHFYRETLAALLTNKEMDEGKLARAADAYAAATVEAWQSKIEEKLGELESAEVQHLSGTSFAITGEKAGRRVRIEQSMILNVSSKGTLFNQYPARIYVNGKFTSAKAYAAL